MAPVRTLWAAAAPASRRVARVMDVETQVSEHVHWNNHCPPKQKQIEHMIEPNLTTSIFVVSLFITDSLQTSIFAGCTVEATFYNTGWWVGSGSDWAITAWWPHVDLSKPWTVHSVQIVQCRSVAKSGSVNRNDAKSGRWNYLFYAFLCKCSCLWLYSKTGRNGLTCTAMKRDCDFLSGIYPHYHIHSAYTNSSCSPAKMGMGWFKLGCHPNMRWAIR